MTAAEIAFVCHEANRAMTALVQDVPVQLAWAAIDEDMRASGIRGVAFAIANPNATPEDMHKAWCEDRRANGWTFGFTKDAEQKRHPSLRPYSELSEGARQKDAVFHAIVKALR